MTLSRTTRVVAATLVAVGLAAATPSIAFAKNGADNPAGHNVNDVRGGHGADNGPGHK
ncbi:MAG: hypothetical protein WCP95_14340 [Actinomycetes bacterium]